MTSVVRQKWFASLASLTYPASPGQAAEAFKAYLPMLAQLPDGAFTQRSLEHVVTSPRKMAIPSYDEIAKPLGVWWRENRPFVPVLPAPVEPDREPPSPELKAIVSALAGQARGILAEALEARQRNNKTPTPPREHHASDGHLLALHDALAAAGGPTAAASAIRADAIRAKMVREAEAELSAHRERQWAEQSQREDA